MNRNPQGTRDSDRGTGDSNAPPSPRNAASDPNRNLERWEQELRGGPHGLGQDGVQPDGAATEDADPRRN